VFETQWDARSILLVSLFVGLTVAVAILYNRRRWVPLAVIATVNLFFFLEGLALWRRAPQPMHFSPLRVAVSAAAAFGTPFTLSMVGILLARRRSIPLRVGLGLGLGLLGTPIVLILVHLLTLIPIWAGKM
jgi:hypothetical protein